MKCKIIAGPHSIQGFPVPANFTSKPMLALSEQARPYGLRWLLAHADDGVIWGEMRDDGLHLSCDAFPEHSPPLRPETLQQMRMFGPLAELLFWRDGAAWQARLIRDNAGEAHGYFDEAHLLWGDIAEQQKNGFLLLRQGKEGLRHAPPLNFAGQLPASLKARPYLKVRHYINYDEDGQAYVAYSRLVTIGGEE